MRYLLCIVLVLITSVAYSEDHYSTGLPMTASGWTDFEAMVAAGTYASARVVFVSSTDGSDVTGTPDTIANVTFDTDGMFQSTGTIHPYATITAAYTQIRTGGRDILLLKRGDTWTLERFVTGSIGPIKAGESSTARHIIASYGTADARPQINGGNDGAPFYAGNIPNIIISGIKFYQHEWETTLDADVPVFISNSGSSTSHHLFEDLVWEKYGEGAIQGGTTKGDDIVIRRCIFKDLISHDGLYTKELTKFVFEENLSYSPVDPTNSDGGGGRHLYMSDEVDHEEYPDIVGNIFYLGGRGIDVRSGGLFSNNFVIGETMLFGGTGGSGGVKQGGYIINNVYDAPRLSTGTISAMKLINNEDTIVANNVFNAQTTAANGSTAIVLEGYLDVLRVAINVEIKDNIIYGWGTSASGRCIDSYLLDTKSIDIHDNDFMMVNGASNLLRMYSGLSGITLSNNNYYSTGAANTWWSVIGDTITDFTDWTTTTGEEGATNTLKTYTDATRNIKTYNVSLGGTASASEFMDEALLQSRQNWRTAYTADAVNDYIRAGFGMSEYRQDRRLFRNVRLHTEVEP